MCKNSLSKDQKMSSIAFVDEAAELANKMVAREARGPGDLANAMGRLEVRYGISYWVLWALRYRKPKSIDTNVYVRILQAYEAECDRQRGLIDNDCAATKPKSRIAQALVRAGDVLAGKES
jgi:hypothetical protein